MSSVRRCATTGVLVLLAGVLVACSSDDRRPGSAGSSGSGARSTASVAALAERPPGPAADLSEEITGANPPFIGSGQPLAFDGTNYVQHEFVASGTASSYKAVGALGGDGRWTFAPDDSAPYRTRVLIRRPSNAADFSGTVVVEWLNVSGGIDADPVWANVREDLMRHGDAWVGVSAQLIGVSGGKVLVSAPLGQDLVGKGLKTIDPERYGSLVHPGDGYSFDMFTQIARAVRAGGAAMGGMRAYDVLAAGDSQSAFALVTYVNGVQPLVHEFDGFYIQSRAVAGLSLVAPGEFADIAKSFGNTPTLFRTDQQAPILDLQSEADVGGILRSITVRQPDDDHFRLWEVAGTAHADLHLLGGAAPSIDCGAPVNNGPLHIVAKAAIRSLDTWVRTGTAPPMAARLETTTDAQPQIVRDADGIALGGVRTPPVDVPVDVLSGVPGSNPSLLCILLGSTKPLSDARLAELYPSRADYQQRYDAATDAAIKAGFVLADDRDALLSFAAPARVQG